MSKYLTLVPAYGRDYKSKKEVTADFNAEKDFRISDFFSGSDGRLVNRQQIDAGTTVNIRYKKLQNICQIKL